MNFLETWHQSLMHMDARVRLVMLLAALAAVVVMALLARGKNDHITIVLAFVAVAAAGTAFGLSQSGAQGVAAVLLAFTTVVMWPVVWRSKAQHKGLRTVIAGLATVVALDATCLAVAHTTSGGVLSYFVGGSADSVNRLACVYILLGVPASLVWAAVMHFVWGRNKKVTPSEA